MSKSLQVLSLQDTHSQARNATSTPRNTIQSEGHRNWIRCNLGLQEIGNAIRSHVDERFREYHEDWQDCYYRCCTKPDCTDLSAHCHYGRKCGYRDYYNHTHHLNGCNHVTWQNGKWEHVVNPHCDTCETQFINVKKLFRWPDSGEISWTNVEFPIWEKGHWELAKAFMPRGNQCTNTPEEAETTALLKVLSTCRLFYIRNYKSKLVKSLIQQRNILIHSSSHEITNDEAKEIFKLLREVLEMLKELGPFKDQLKNLQTLQETQVTGELIKRAYAATIQDLLKSISDLIATGEDASNLLESLKSIIALQKQEHIMIDYEAEMEKLKEEIRTGMTRETSLENLVKEKEQMIEAKDTIIKELEIKTKRLQEVKEREVKELTEEINKLKMRISKLLKDIESKDDNSEELNRQLLLKDAYIKEKMKEMKAVSEEQNITIMSLNDKVKMLKETKAELQRSQKELEDIVTKLSAEKIKLERAIDDQTARKKEEIKGLREKINQLNMSNDQRKKEIGNLSNILIVVSILTVIISVSFLRIGNFFCQE